MSETVSILPTFLIIGTYRAGTTWLHEALRSHPQLCLPDEKELMFFSHHFDKGDRWYSSFFEHCDPKRIRGEICPSYLSCEAAPSRIRAVLGHPKLIATLRRPSEQIASLHELWVARGRDHESLGQAIVSKPWLIENALYAKHIKNFESVFGAGSIKILFYESLVSDSKAYLDEVFEFLEVEPVYSESLNERRNSTRRVHYRFLERLIARGGDFLRRNGMLGVKSALNRTGAVRMLKRFNTDSIEPPAITEGELQSIALATQNDRVELGEMLGMDLTDWI